MTRSSTSVGSTATRPAILTGSSSAQSSVEVADAGLAGDQGVPGGGDVAADGAGGAESGDDDSLAQLMLVL